MATSPADAAVREPAAPFAAVFPGEVVLLETLGRPVTVAPWGVKALTQEVPALLGRILAKLGPIFQTAKAGVKADALTPMLLTQASAELVEFVAWTAKLTAAEIDALSAGDFLRLARAIVRQNNDFFDQLSGLYADLGRPLERAVTGNDSDVPGSS